jgi:hypothetical protein
VLNALDRLAGSYGPDCASVRQELAIAEGQLRDYEARLGAPFAHASYLAALTALRDQLKAGLSGAAPEAGAAPLPTVSELAERIKALKGAHTIEALPERAGTRRAEAEEPVTTRIRRRTEAIVAAEPAATSPPACAKPELRFGEGRPPESLGLPGPLTPEVSITPETTHQERAATSRRRKERQTILF